MFSTVRISTFNLQLFVFSGKPRKHKNLKTNSSHTTSKDDGLDGDAGGGPSTTTDANSVGAPGTNTVASQTTTDSSSSLDGHDDLDGSHFTKEFNSIGIWHEEVIGTGIYYCDFYVLLWFVKALPQSKMPKHIFNERNRFGLF